MSTENNKEPENEIPAEKVVEASVEIVTDPKISDGTLTGDRTMAMLCHLLSFVGILGVPLGNIWGPLVIWLVKKDQDDLVDANGKAVLNFQISVTIYGIICGLLVFIFIGIILLPILIIAVIIYTIIGALKANEGQVYQYPFTIQFIK